MRIIAYISFFLFSSVAISQTVLVMNIATDEPVENVAIFSSDRTISVMTDSDGKASLTKFKESDTLFFQHPSYVMYAQLKRQLSDGQKVYLERKIIIIPEFVITASKHLEDQSEIAHMVDVISPKKLSLLPSQTSADILSSTGNIFVQKSQGAGGSPVLRGFEANKVLLVIDGVRMNNAIYRGGHLQNAISIDNAVLDRAEIIYGPTSVIYGSDALGGVIHYITRDPELSTDPNRLRYGVSAYGQYASVNQGKKVHFDFSLGSQKLASLSSITVGDYGDIKMGERRIPFLEDYSKNFHYVERINGVDSMLSSKDPSVQKYTGYSQYDFLQKFRYKPTQRMEYVLNLQYSTTSNLPRYDQLNNYDGDQLEFAEWYYGPQERALASLRSTFKSSTGIYSSLTATIGFQNIVESRHSRRFKHDTMVNQEEDVRVYTANIDAVKELAANSRIYYGVDFNINEVRSEAHLSNIVDGGKASAISRYPDDGTTTFSTAAYVSYKHKFGNKYILNVGGRINNYSLNSSYSDEFDMLPSSKISINNTALTGSLSLVYKQSKSMVWNFILSTGFRSPNLDDLAKIRASSSKITIPNSKLDPEFTYNAELGLSKTWDGYIQINGSYFVTYLSDAIVREKFYFEDGSDSLFFQGKWQKTYQNVNAAEALLHGFHFSLLSDLNSGISFKATLNYTYGKNLTDDGPMAHIPPIFGKTNVTYKVKKFINEIYFNYAGWKHMEDMVLSGEDKEDEATIHGFPGWYTINLRTSYSFSELMQFQLAVENLTDNFYKPFASGVAGPGRNFVATLRLKI